MSRLPPKPRTQNFKRGVQLVGDWQAMGYTTPGKPEVEALEDLLFMISFEGRQYKDTGPRYVCKHGFTLLSAIQFMTYLVEEIKRTVLQIEKNSAFWDQYDPETIQFRAEAMGFLENMQALSENMLNYVDGMHRAAVIRRETQDGSSD